MKNKNISKGNYSRYSLLVTLFLALPLFLGNWSLVLAQDISSFSGADLGGYIGDPINENEYKLGPGDQISANLIVGDNALSLDYFFTIGPDGKIYFPKVGEMKLLGLSILEAKELMNDKIKKVYNEQYAFSFRLTQPRKVQVYVTGSENRPVYIGDKKFVYVYGAVTKSGRFEYLPGRKFSDYISYAGGPQANANLAATTLTRETKKYSINGNDVIFNGNLKADVEILPGDVINVPNKFIYFADLGGFASTVFNVVAIYNLVNR